MELPLNSLQTGPVHLNIQFEEPLIGDDDESWLDQLVVTPTRIFTRKSAGTLHTKSTRGVLVIGHDRGGLPLAAVEEFAQELGWPIITEDPLSFPKAIAHASIFLNSKAIAEDLKPDTVVIIGRTTLSRPVNSFIKLARREIVIDPRIATVDSDRLAAQRFTQLPSLSVLPADNEFCEKWQKYAARAVKSLAEIKQWSEPIIARQIAAALPVGTTLFISSSRPIRDIEGFALPRTGVETFANRGLAGIDGNISTALGIASQRKDTIALLGDLGFLHDLTGLLHN